MNSIKTHGRGHYFSLALAGLLAASSLVSSSARADLTLVSGVDTKPLPETPNMPCYISSINSPTNAEAPTNGTLRAACPNAAVETDLLDQRVRDLYVHSDALNDNVWIRLILPASWTPTSTVDYPVLFLLTGRGAGFQSFTCNTLIQNYVQNADVIVAMPDAHRKYNRCNRAEKIADNALPGWYSDWVWGTATNPEKWETFHTVELPKLLRTKYKGTGPYAVAGLSMGGYGAVKYLMKYPSLFKAAASYSGMLNTVSPAGVSAVSAALAAANQDTNALWGYFPGTPADNATGNQTQWYANNPTNNAAAAVSAMAAGAKMFISAGDGQQGSLVSSYDFGLGTIEAATKSASVNFVNAVKSANGGALPANMTTQLMYHGTHQWKYWDAELCQSLNILLPSLSTPQKPITNNNPVPCRIP